MSNRGVYLAVTIVALVVAVWLGFQILGFLLKLLLFVAAVVVAFMAYGAWRAQRPDPGRDQWR
jgi:membrane protein implicated in regulation of membrane protease activity